MKDLLIYFYAESPVHAGASDTDGDVDLPIQREGHSLYPTIFGQSLKGAFRQAAHDRVASGGTDWSKADIDTLFGSPPGKGGSTTPGLLMVGDAQLVAMPVPTLQKTFAWVTSELALGRLARKYHAIGVQDLGGVPKNPAQALPTRGEWGGEQTVGPLVLHVDCKADPTELRDWAERIREDAFDSGPTFNPFGSKFTEDLLLVNGDAMVALVKESTEVSVRVQLKQDDKVVDKGPFQSEYLPAETLLACTITLCPSHSGVEADRRHEELLASLLHDRGSALHQIGGDESLGKGLVWTRIAGREGR
ncbi:type III-B CRISPR module RAMP protein Cmr4 [Nocardiopsis kunsanensis]|uniref:type III-B CRISPR module RAMP protein Cmr4 n=1 Tax=Nocardiopsis kunsanensis TaxID=141693 RepID=UPI0003479E6E|nr:type III-B CRISPR module RAMP protein Cmr4 [Nocardiopsis kunsanensis]